MTGRIRRGDREAGRRWPAAVASAAAVACLTLLLAAATASPTVASVAAEGELADGGNRDGHYCDGCAPPMDYVGGPVMDTSGDTGIVITPVFWAPDGFAFPPGYVDGILRYLHDVAVDSGGDANVYSLATEYPGNADGETAPLDYRLTDAAPVYDPTAFPGAACAPDDDISSVCLTDDELRTELARLVATGQVATGMDRFTPVFLPPGVEAQDRDGTTSASTFCGYHRMFGEGERAVVYSNEPFEAVNCDAGQAPNGSLALDGSISTLSHELAEAMTDPDTENPAWLDDTGHEIGDLCAEDFGTALGSTDPSDPYGTLYNQLINGHPYYTQTEFSNGSFDAYGAGFGCAQSVTQATTDPSEAPDDVAEIFTDVTPNSLEGTDVATLELSIVDRAGEPVVGDRITLSTYAVRGDGTCGTFAATTATTDGNGRATATYTGSGDPVVCALVALEAKGGYSAISRVYQGSTAATAPNADTDFPAALEAGGDARYVTATFTNPASDRIDGARVELDLFPAEGSRTPVDASQLHVDYSLSGAAGPFHPVELTGSTAEGGVIRGYVEPDGGLSIAPHSTDQVLLRVQLASGVPTSAPGPQLSAELFLDAVNAATGSGTTIADSYASDLRIVPATPWLLRPRVLTAFGAAAVILALALIPWAIVSGRRRRHAG